MRVTLTVLSGPNVGHAVVSEGHDAFIVGRSRWTSRLPHKDGYLSRHHFLVEISPPQCRVVDLDSRNGTFVNGKRVTTADLIDGDVVKAGRTAFRVSVGGAPVTATGGPGIGPTTIHVEADADVAVPGYRVVSELGRGGMGVVYEAVREADGRVVALKTIRPSGGADRAAAERFTREAAILRRLDHPNVVKFHDGGEAAGVLWFAMEYVPGPDAGRWVGANGPMPVPAAVEVTRAVLDGLGYAHRLGYVHRDIKPANVFLVPGPGGTFAVKVGDFGLARAYDASLVSGLTLTGDVGGTPAFMAPEQLLDFRNVGPQADLYSTAATLYYLLTGHFIFDLPAHTVGAYVFVLDEPPVPIRSRRPDVPEALAEAIHRALDKNPARRSLALDALAP
ncbi:protein kinase [bacterium]|nr:protein kinase [bacterium]